MSLGDLPVLTRTSCSAFEVLGHPVWVFSPETLRILASNSAAQDWLGYSKSEFEALSILDIRPAEERAVLLEHVGRMGNGKGDDRTWTIVDKAGARRKAMIGWQKVSFDSTVAVVATVTDTTRLLRVESDNDRLEQRFDALAERSELAEASFRRLFEAAPGKMLVLKPGSFEIAAVTDEYAASTMTDRSRLYGRKLFDVFPDDPDDPAADGMANLRASLQRVETLAVTDVMNVQRYPVRRPSGDFEERYWMPLNKPVFDRAGELLYIIHRVEDVTSLLKPTESDTPVSDYKSLASGALPLLMQVKSSMAVLQEREARLRIAERLLGLGAWEYDVETRRLSLSLQARAILGLSPETSTLDLDAYVAHVHLADRQKVADAFARLHHANEAQIVCQHQVVRADGSVGHVRGVGERQQVFDKETVVGFVQDITDTISSQARLLEAARMQRIAGQVGRLGAWRASLASGKLYWSAETAAIHEEPPDIEPTVEQGIDYYAPEDRDTIRRAFEACRDQGRSFDEVLQIISAKGNRVWVRAIGEPVRDDQGAIVAVEGAFQDVSELVTIRGQAAALSQRLHQTLDHISDAFFLVDRDWRFSFINLKAETLLQRNRDDLLGRIVWDEFPEAVGSVFQQQYQRAVEENRKVAFQEYFPPLETWFEVNAYPTPEGLAVYFRDVTSEHEKDEQLRLLGNAVSQQNDILLITEASPIDGPDGPKIVYVNDAFVKRTGYSREEAIGRTPRFLQGPETRRSELDRIRAALERSEAVRAELVNYTKSGDKFWLELNIVPVADQAGRYTHLVAVERDISDRKAAEELTRINEERFRLVTRATNDVIWDWNLTTGTLWWNDNLKTMFGHDPAQVAPGAESWMNNIHPEDRDRVLESIHAAIDGTASNWTSEYRFMDAASGASTVIDRGFIIRNKDGLAVRMVGSMMDITEQLEMERKLQQSQKLEVVGQLTGGVAHDFNNLLTVILGNSEMLQDELGAQSPLSSLAEMTVAAAERGAELTRRLLAFSRKQSLAPRVVDVNKLIGGVEELLRRTLGEHINIAVVRAKDVWLAEIDPGQLESALLNMAINARDAMSQGGDLVIETRNTTLDDDDATPKSDITPGEYVEVSVRDTGHGMTPDIVERVFEPFFTTKEVGKGSGLGLSMVYGFVKQSGGHIRVDSQPGLGTSIRLYFPRSHAAAGRQKAQTDKNASVGGNESILVVEDDALVRENVHRQLRGLGYRVVEASSGPEALEVLQRVPSIDLLFTDIVMPAGMNGWELANAAKAMKPHLKVLFTSGYAESGVAGHGGRGPGFELLDKPYRREELAARVRRVLDQD